MKDAYFKEGFFYIRTNLCPYYVNISLSKGSTDIGLSRHNSNLWYLEPIDAKSSSNFPVIINLNAKIDEEVPAYCHYSNYQFITDLFEILLKESSDFGDFDYDHIIQEYPRSVDIGAGNRYTARLVHENRNMVILTNPPSYLCKSLMNKSKKLINLLGNYV